jgi:aspartyl aminopeptidase
MDFVCIGQEWAPVTVFGNIYLMFVSMVVLLQINASQFICIRLPFNEGIFDSRTKQSIKENLLKKMLTRTASDMGENSDLKKRLMGIAKTSEDFRI